MKNFLQLLAIICVICFLVSVDLNKYITPFVMNIIFMVAVILCAYEIYHEINSNKYRTKYYLVITTIISLAMIVVLYVVYVPMGIPKKATGGYYLVMIGLSIITSINASLRRKKYENKIDH